LKDHGEALEVWVRGGGVLAVNGEGVAATVLRDLFGKPWAFEGDYYRRCDFVRVCPDAQLPARYCVKATMLSRVAPAERLYSRRRDR
jgi:hypothetical protein